MFKISTIKESDGLGDPNLFGLTVSYGEVSKDPNARSSNQEKAGFFFFLNKEQYKVLFLSTQSKKLEPVIFIGGGPYLFDDYEEDEAALEIDSDFKVCFVFGTWWPSETNTSNKVDIYFNIVSRFESFWYREIFFLRAVAAGENLEASVYITKGKDFTKSSPVDKKAIVAEETKKLISIFDGKRKTLVGHMNCKINENSKLDIALGLNKLKKDGNGEFEMAFVTSNYDNVLESIAATKFAIAGTVKDSTTTNMDTPWATVKCAGNGIELASKFEYLNRDEGQGDKVFERIIRKNDQSVGLISFDDDNSESPKINI